MDNVLALVYPKLRIIDIDIDIIAGNSANIEVEEVYADLLLFFRLLFTRSKIERHRERERKRERIFMNKVLYHST